jgi:hypothetical protein
MNFMIPIAISAKPVVVQNDAFDANLSATTEFFLLSTKATPEQRVATDTKAKLS